MRQLDFARTSAHSIMAHVPRLSPRLAAWETALVPVLRGVVSLVLYAIPGLELGTNLLGWFQFAISGTVNPSRIAAVVYVWGRLSGIV